jgi:hypothetical protein
MSRALFQARGHSPEQNRQNPFLAELTRGRQTCTKYMLGNDKGCEEKGKTNAVECQAGIMS